MTRAESSRGAEPTVNTTRVGVGWKTAATIGEWVWLRQSLCFTLLLHEKGVGRRGLIHMQPVESQLLNFLLEEAKVH